MESAIMKQRAFVEDVKRSAAIAGSETDKKAQIDEIMKERSTYAEKVRSLSDSNRKTIRQLSEEITPRLNNVTNKIKQLENSKNVKLEVRICGFVFSYQKVNFKNLSICSCFAQDSIKFIKELCGCAKIRADSKEKSMSR